MNSMAGTQPQTAASAALTPRLLGLGRRAWLKRASRVVSSFMATIIIFLIQNDSGPTPSTFTKFPEDDLLKMYPFRDPENYTKMKSSGRTFNLAGCLDFQCNKDIDVCDNILPTNYDGTKPPCCSHILRDMARTFDGVMSKLGLQYFLGFGTLLGLIRSDKVIPWTADDDFVIIDGLTSTLSLWDNSTGLDFITLPWPPRMCITKAFANGKLQKWGINSTKLAGLPVFKKGYPYGDIYPMKNLTDKFIGREYPRCKHLYTDIFPIERRLVYNKSFALNFPKEPEQLLRRYYGLDWKIPLSNKAEHGGGSPLICKYLYGLEDF
eukprot:CAMPEP_0196132254 /NCGR_PEP_ID=MMETSP0910-20130528/1960_1 /TAXON_ID=49265 /ORGANISM="Thalassiosira rotula, Strain GSO102" /LENGTH=321 /DNA_ID=CAMNT_0041391851 /DNA_START=124 /DNA_END=1089 /DNA_ORIENTATION=+